jgi:hypothetical protein
MTRRSRLSDPRDQKWDGWTTTGSMDSPMMRQRNNALYDSIIQPGSEFPLHPQQPQQTIVADVLQKMLTISALVNETVVQLRTVHDWLSLPLPWGQICLVTNR